MLPPHRHAITALLFFFLFIRKKKEQLTLSLECELMFTVTGFIVQFIVHSSERSNACGFLSFDSWDVFWFFVSLQQKAN